MRNILYDGRAVTCSFLEREAYVQITDKFDWTECCQLFATAVTIFWQDTASFPLESSCSLPVAGIQPDERQTKPQKGVVCVVGQAQRGWFIELINFRDETW